MKRINQTLAELIIGILASGILIQLVCLVFAGPDAGFALSFWAGIVTAVLLSFHMYRSIDRAVDMLPADAQKYMKKGSLMRSLFIMAVAGGVCWIQAEDIRAGDILAVFLGILCLKFGAFLQPVVHRFVEKRNKKC